MCAARAAPLDRGEPYIGRLFITIHKAQDLHSVSVLTMDPYVKIRLNDHEFKTKVSEDGGQNPIWDQAFLFDLTQNDRGKDVIRFTAWNRELISDDKIGDFSIELYKLIKYGGVKRTLKLVDLYTAEQRGLLDITVEWNGKPSVNDIASPTPVAQPVQIEPVVNQIVYAMPIASAPLLYDDYKHLTDNNVMLPHPALPVTEASQNFFIRDFTGNHYLGCAETQGQLGEYDLLWFKEDNVPADKSLKRLFYIEDGYLRHRVSGFYVHPKLGNAIAGNELVIANGIGDNARFKIDNFHLLQEKSGLYLSVQGKYACLAVEPRKLRIQYEKVKPASLRDLRMDSVENFNVTIHNEGDKKTEDSSQRKNPVFWLRHNATTEYVGYGRDCPAIKNTDHTVLEIRPAKAVWNNQKYAMKFDNYDNIITVWDHNYLTPYKHEDVTYVSVVDQPSEATKFAFSNGLIQHTQTKLYLNVLDNKLVLQDKKDVGAKWSLDLGKK